MPPILIAFFIAVGFATTYDLPGAMAHGADPQRAFINHVRPHVEYRVWTAPRLDAMAVNRQCKVRYFALVTGEEQYRLRVDTIEQLLDTSWTFDYVVPEGTKITHHFLFQHPITGEYKWVHRSFMCHPGYRPQTIKPAEF